MRVLIVSEKVGELYGQERIVMESSRLLRDCEVEVEWITAFPLTDFQEFPQHSLPDLFRANSFTPQKKRNRMLDELWKIADQKKNGPTLIHFVDHLAGFLFRESARRHPTLYTAHTAAPTCPASGRVVKGLPVCPQKSGPSCLLNHYRYDCLNHFKSPLHRAHAVWEFEERRRGLSKAHRILAVSRFLKDALARENFAANKLNYVPNPVTVPENFTTVPLPKTRYLVSASRLVPLKGIDVALRALAKVTHEEWEYVILGDGPQRAQWEKLAAELGIHSRVHFLGHRKRAETMSFLKSAYAFIHPGMGPEGFGMSAAEASALGVPVIASAVPGIDEVVVPEETGLLSPMGEIEAFALSLTRILNHPDLKDRFGAAGRARMEAHYSAEKHVSETLKIYRALI